MNACTMKIPGRDGVGFVPAGTKHDGAVPPSSLLTKLQELTAPPRTDHGEAYVAGLRCSPEARAFFFALLAPASGRKKRDASREQPNLSGCARRGPSELPAAERCPGEAGAVREEAQTVNTTVLLGKSG